MVWRPHAVLPSTVPACRWYSWVFEVTTSAYDAASQSTTFNFSQTRGGNQGSRGGNAGQVSCVGMVVGRAWVWGGPHGVWW